jgi:Carboxypeptidase regulatory-like domain
VRFDCRKDISVLTQNCPIGRRTVVPRLSRAAGIVFLAMVSAVPLAARTVNPGQAQTAAAEAALHLSVLDVRGAVCANADVIISSLSNPLVIHAITDSNGILRLRSLAPNSYSITVIAFPGLQTYAGKVHLRPQTTEHLNVILQVWEPLNWDGHISASAPIIPLIEAPAPLIDPLPVRAVYVRPQKPGQLQRLFHKIFHR